jgi:hypothetical protein
MRGQFDETAVSIVVDERVAMRLRGADRIEAVRRLDALSVPGREILQLLMWDADSLALTRFRQWHHLPNSHVKTYGLSRRALGMGK